MPTILDGQVMSWSDAEQQFIPAYVGSLPPGPGGITGFAAPSATVGLSAVAGVATTVLRSDSAPALNQGIAPTWTALHTFGSGDNQQMWGNTTSAQRILVSRGTAGTPDNTFNPLIKVQRTLSVTDAAVNAAGLTGDSAENFAAATFIAVGVSGCEVQPVGVAGFAKNNSASNPATNDATRADAVGGYFVGNITGSGVGVGIGGYFVGRRESTAATYTGIEIQAQNWAGSNTSYNSTGFASSAMWINANGNADTGAAILVSNPFGRQFDYGLAFTAQVTSAKTGGVKTASIRDDSNATTSLLVNGTRTNAINTSGATLSGYALLMASAQQVGWNSDAGLVRGAAATVKVTNGSSGYGTLDAGVVVAQVGAAATPSFTFSGDTDTGLYRVGANSFGFSTNGVARAAVGDTFFSLDVPLSFATDNTKDIGFTTNRPRNGYFGTAVGIATTTLTHALNVNGDAAVNGLISNGATFNLANTVATTLNLGGAATTLAMGNSAGTMTVNSGTLTVAGTLLNPGTGFNTDIGQLTKKFRALHAAELWVETLVAQDTLATIGGRILVGPTTYLIADLSAVATTIDVKHNNIASGDRLYLEANGNVEFLAVTSGATVITGGFRYTVTRNLDATGANTWTAGDALFNTGTTGSGWIDLYSIRSVKSATQAGPTIVGNIRNSGTFNDWSEHWAIGNLKGLYGYGSTTFGAAFGEYAASKTHITIDSTNGYRTFSGLSTVVQQIDGSGNITVGEVAASKSNILISAGVLQLRNNTTVRSQIAADGSAHFGTNIAISAAGVLTAGGWTINSSSIASTGIALTSGANAGLAFGTTPPTSASVGTGIWLDRTGFYGLAANVVQAQIDATTGAFTSAAGNVIMDVSGMRLLASTSKTTDRSVSWYSSGDLAFEIGGLKVTGGGVITNAFTLTSIQSGTPSETSVGLNATGGGFGGNSFIIVKHYGSTHPTTPNTSLIDITAATIQLNGAVQDNLGNNVALWAKSGTVASHTGSAQINGTNNTTAFTVDATAGGIRAQGYSSPTTGTGIEFGYYPPGPYGFMQVFDRAGGVYKDFLMEASKIIFNSNAGGAVGFGTASPVVSGSGNGRLHMAGDTFRLGVARTPASAAATGNTGEWCWDSGFVYVCVATNTWKRAALATW